jgi:hypothetical protein
MSCSEKFGRTKLVFCGKVIKKSKAVPLHAMEAHGGRVGIAPLIFNFGH